MGRIGSRILYEHRYIWSQQQWQEARAEIIVRPERILELMRDDSVLGSPKGIMALADTLNSNSQQNFAVLLATIKSKDKAVFFDSFWFDKRPLSIGLFKDWQWERASVQRVNERSRFNPFRFTRPLRLRAARSVPTTPQEVFDEIFSLAMA